MSRDDLWFILTQVLVACILLSVYKTALDVYPPIRFTKPITNARVYKNLYLDQNLNELYTLEIELAAHRWNRVTNHMAEFHVVQLPVADMDTVREDPNGIVVTMVSRYHPDVINLDKGNKDTTVAFCNMKATIPILAYVDSRIRDDIFEKVTMHELGHAMGMGHSNEDGKEGGEYQIMYSGTSAMSDEVTDADLKAFCEIYHCDSSKLRAEPVELKHQEEPLHF